MTPFYFVAAALAFAPILPAEIGAPRELEPPAAPEPDFDPGWYDMTPRGLRAGKIQAPLELRVARRRHK